MKDDLIKLLRDINNSEAILPKQIDIPTYVDKLYEKAKINTIYKNGLLKGFIAFYANSLDKDLAYLTMIIVESNSIGKGIGAQLLSKAVLWLKNNGFKKLGLEVLETNQRAISFYQRNGFFTIEQRPNHFIYMEKKIN